MEGRVLTRQHHIRERYKDIVKYKKAAFRKKHGGLWCEICLFNFSKAYGPRGDGFIECHHVQPLSQLDPGAKTKLSDLLCVCANCHRMLHYGKPWLTIDELRALLAQHGRAANA